MTETSASMLHKKEGYVITERGTVEVKVRDDHYSLIRYVLTCDNGKGK